MPSTPCALLDDTIVASNDSSGIDFEVHVSPLPTLMFHLLTYLLIL